MRSPDFERWKARHPEAAAHLEPADVLVDAMRGRFRTWTRIRVNLQHVPEALRPAQEPLDPDEDMANDWTPTRSARSPVDGARATLSLRRVGAGCRQRLRSDAPKTFASS